MIFRLSNRATRLSACVASFLVICFANFWIGVQVEDFRNIAAAAKLNSSITAREHSAWTDGFNNGVQCGLIAYTYAPEDDPAKSDIPVMTLRAHYWYVVLKDVKQYSNAQGRAGDQSR